jgi:hypothetical protein
MPSTRSFGLGLLALGMTLGGCADPHYNLDVRNMTSEPVDLRLVAKDKKETEPRTVAQTRVAAGSNGSIFTKGQRGEAPYLEARVDGDPEGEPATLKIRSGLSSIDVFPATPGSKTRLRLREVVRE